MLGNIAYLDCSSGISGDMFLGSLVGVGLPFEVLESELKKLYIQHYRLKQMKVTRAGVEAIKVNVEVEDKGLPARTWSDVQKVIMESEFSSSIKSKGLALFRRLFDKEAKVHGESFDKVHLHELAGIDCLVDVFGVLVGLDALGISEVYASSVNLGSGTVKTRHGLLPVPAPATAELLRGVNVYSDNTPFELTTPTGALLVTSIAQQIGYMPKMQLQAIGCGAGTHEIPGKPNILRMFMGKPCDSGFDFDSVIVVETNIDDMDPRLYEPLIERLFASQALEVFITPIIMKKSRPAAKLTVLVKDNYLNPICDILLQETTTFGVRFYRADRQILSREIRTVDTTYGPVDVKVGKFKGKVLKVIPEYDDLKKASSESNIPINKIIEEVSWVIKQTVK